MSDIFAHIKPEEEYAEMRAEIVEKGQQIDTLIQQNDSLIRQVDSLSREVTELRSQITEKRRFPFNIFKRSCRYRYRLIFYYISSDLSPSMSDHLGNFWFFN